MSTVDVSFVVPEDFDGKRLDRALEVGFPRTSLRYRRRIWDVGHVFVDGVERSRSFKVRQGMGVFVRHGRDGSRGVNASKLTVIFANAEFGAVLKPGFMHSAALAGKPGECVESIVPKIFSGRNPILLNRLDYLTSGLLMVAFGREAADFFRAAEDAGKVEKQYFAVVRGRDGFAEQTILKGRLETADRRRTKLLPRDGDDPLRWTAVRRLKSLDASDCALVSAVIRKGARHQIRAHLAGAGHPIVGDPLYGDGREGDVLHLHHVRIRFPGFEATADPCWNLPEFGSLKSGEWA